VALLWLLRKWNGVAGHEVCRAGSRVFQEVRVADSAAGREKNGFAVSKAGGGSVFATHFGSIMSTYARRVREVGSDMRVRVECYSGRKAYERPRRLGPVNHMRIVEEVLESWYGPSDAFFNVRADDGIVYILRHDTSVADGKWSLVAFNNFKAG